MKKKLIRTLKHNNTTREFILYVPESYYSKSKVPLVLNFHGGTSLKHIEETADMRQLSDESGVILAYPQGLELNNIVQVKKKIIQLIGIRVDPMKMIIKATRTILVSLKH